MTFTPSIPYSGETLGTSRTQVLGNFTNYNNVVSVDHVAPNASGQGEHTKVTFNTTGSTSSPPYTVTANKSYLYSSAASAAGTQVVYQPSVASIFVPCTPRALARVTKSGGSPYWIFGNGPYGSGTNFNAGSITAEGGSTNKFVFNFSSALATSNYFVMMSCEAPDGSSFGSVFSYNKTTSSFYVSVGNSSSIPSGTSILIMVY